MSGPRYDSRQDDKVAAARFLALERAKGETLGGTVPTGALRSVRSVRLQEGR